LELFKKIKIRVIEVYINLISWYGIEDGGVGGIEGGWGDGCEAVFIYSYIKIFNLFLNNIK